MRRHGRTAALITLLLAAASAAAAAAAQTPQPSTPQLKVFLDCDRCFRDYLQSEVVFVDYVRDRKEADVHVLITSVETGGGGREYTAAFTGLGRLQGVDHTLRAVTTTSDPADVIRLQLATTLRIGLLQYIAREGVPQRLSLDVELGTEQQRPAVAGDRWNNWVFSLRASASMEGEESSRELQLNGSVGADRITPDWKITLGGRFDHERQ